EAALAPDGTLRVRVSLKDDPAPAQRLCVYIAIKKHSSKPPGKSGKASATSLLDGLVTAYDFESEGDTVMDVSGNEHGGEAKGIAKARGHTGKGASFDGREARILVKPRKDLNPTRGLTAQAWVKLDRPDTGTILYKAYQYALFVVKTEAGICFSSTTRAGDFLNVTSPSPVKLGAWTHVAMTHDGSLQRLYIDGVLAAEDQQGELTTSRNYLSLGASCYAPPKVYNHLACTIDDVRIYSRPLNQAEIQLSMRQAIPAVAVFRPTWVQRQGRPVRPISDWSERGWGYLSVAEGMVLGSYTAPVRDPQSAWAPRAESAALFALAKDSGQALWTHRPMQSMSNNEIVHSDSTVFLVDATSNSTVSLARRRGEDSESTQELVALELADGEEVWRQSDVPTPGHRTHTPESGPVFLFIAHRSQLQVAHGVVVVDGVAAYDADNGRKLWQRSGRFNKLAAIHDDMLIAPPYAYGLRTGERCSDTDVLTGQKSAWRFIKAYGCGAAIGCKDLLMFRSGSFGFLDLKTRGTTTFAGGKPSCNVSMIPANGLVIAAEGSSGCACSYNFQTSLALMPTESERDVWFAFPAIASRGPLQSLRINFGAPGDRRDKAGNAWLGFPRPELGGVVPVSLAAQLSDPDYVFRPSQRRGTPHWLYHCGLRGRGRISVDLVGNSTLPIQPTTSPPTIDGSDMDVCWQQAKPTPFLDTGRVALAPKVELKLLRDDANLYAMCRRRGIPPETGGFGAQESFQLFITDGTRKRAARFGIAPDGTAFEEGGPRAKRKNLDAAWNGEWQRGVVSDDSGWIAEFAIPLATLAERDLQLDKLVLNAMARLQTNQGQREIYLTDPIFRFAHCVRFLPVTAPAPPAEERSFTVRLHVPAGQRARFVVQGKDAAATLKAGKKEQQDVVVRELRGIRARETLSVDLIPTSTDVLPCINALEIQEETSR
ncbi:MAG: PQQ-binding-like beta-propeller repeat protein, partial [Lentisphaerae bacterium]|nr:PQQ-binding-like beta-propeller repeat protein [Lentisphaerota bacterium]